MNHRLRGFLRGLLRWLLIGLSLVLLFIGWRAFLHFGPGRPGEPGPGMFQFHAKALVRQRIAFPRPAADVLLPVPQAMSSADVQLRLMKWRDGKNWLPGALARGESGKAGLRLHAGQLTLVEITRVGPAETKDGQTICSVRFKVRWDFPEDLQELLRVKEIVNLRLPKGLGPGQSGEITCTFVQQGWRWDLASVESPWGGTFEGVARTRNWSDWLF